MEPVWIWSAVAAVCAVITLQIVIGTVAIKNVDRINKAEAKAIAAKDRADTASIAAAGLNLEIERVEKDLVEHRVAVAREYVSKSTLESLETRIVDAINRLGDRLNDLFDQRRSPTK